MIENYFVHHSVEVIVSLMIMAIIFGLALIQLRERHFAGKRLQAYLGAILFGLMFGGIVGFILTPLNMSRMHGDLSMEDPEYLERYFPALFLFLLVIRTQLTTRLPLIGGMVRAYRAANLRRTIEKSEAQLEKFIAMDSDAGETVNGNA
ncbi:MAG: hypothetical protein ACWA5L_06080 [bacterium]